MSYKQVLSHQYPASALGARPIAAAIVPREDGTVAVMLSHSPEFIPLLPHTSDCYWSTPLLIPQTSSRTSTPDGRFTAEVILQRFGRDFEYSLMQTNTTTGRTLQVRLGARPQPLSKLTPRLMVTPDGQSFVVDDDGTARVFSVADLHPSGAFQVAHADTENHIVSLAISGENTLIAALSSWKDFVLYNLAERRLIAVRQVRDPLGWYDRGPGLIAVAGEGDAILTVGIGMPHGGDTTATPIISVSGFLFVPQDDN